MVGSDVASTNHDRPAGVAECFQCIEHGVRSPSSEIRAVLKSEPTRAAFSDDANCFEEEARTFAFDAFAFGIGAADVLAGWASDNDVGKPSKISQNALCRKGADIIVNLHSGIVLGVEDAPPFDRLASRHRLETGAVLNPRHAPKTFPHPTQAQSHPGHMLGVLTKAQEAVKLGVGALEGKTVGGLVGHAAMS